MIVEKYHKAQEIQSEKMAILIFGKVGHEEVDSKKRT